MRQRGGIFTEKEQGPRVQRQITLPWSKAFEISLKSLKIRFWRSMITMSGIILAIAFLMSIWTNNALITSFQRVDRADPSYNELQTVLVKHKIDPRGAGGLEAKDIWLITLSLLVCIVGIVNAMLMSVTERYREIGTMKCLGALNGFIIKLFLLESSLQGISGTVLGIILGFILAYAKGAISFGRFAFRYFPFTSIASYALISLLIGSGLSVIAAIFPAYRASLMQPVDALRVEE